MPLIPLLAACLALFIAVRPVGAASASDPGEFSIRATLPLDSAQRERLRELIATDTEAAALFAQLQREAEPLQSLQPHPLRVIRYEGLLNTHPERIATVARLREMSDVATLVLHWQATADPASADTLRRFILAWAATYAPTGNDVNENKFYPLFVAYEALRDTFAPAERERVDTWLLRMGEFHAAAVRDSRSFSNRHTKHVRLLSLFGRILQRPEWIDSAATGIRLFVTGSLRPDGTSYDLEQRDSLTYHNSALRPVIELAVLAGPPGPSLYAWESPTGGSLKKSVAYVVPFASGKKTREEWRNTKVELDRRRAVEGIEAYRPGRLYEPQNALRLIEEASYFDPTLLPLVLKLHQSTARRFASWTMVVNAAASPPNSSS